MNSKSHYGRDTRPTIDELLTAAGGRWIDILADAGLPIETIKRKGQSCPRCGGRDRFAVWPDVSTRGAVHCRRCFTKGSDPKPGDGLATLRWLMGCDTATACQWLAQWLGITDEPAKRTKPRPVVRSIRLEREADQALESMGNFAERCRAAMRPMWWPRLADRLRLPADVLIRLGVGWSFDHRALTWPMVDADGRVIGIRLRCIATGRKWSVRGGRAGLFVPDDLADVPERLFITEGPTDCAAVLSIGLQAIGRASCAGSVATECATVRRIKPTECVIVADRDEAGRRGAETLAVPLLTCCRSVRVIAPPELFGDARDWVAGGATAADVAAVVDAAAVRALRLSVGVKL